MELCSPPWVQQMQHIWTKMLKVMVFGWKIALLRVALPSLSSRLSYRRHFNPIIHITQGPAYNMCPDFKDYLNEHLPIPIPIHSPPAHDVCGHSVCSLWGGEGVRGSHLHFSIAIFSHSFYCNIFLVQYEIVGAYQSSDCCPLLVKP